MNEFKEIMKDRTKRLSLKTLRECERLPKTMVYDALGGKLVRSITSVGANYRAACRAKSRADFLNKLHIVEEECDESIYWIEILEELTDSSFLFHSEIKKELNEIFAIIIKALTTTIKNGKKHS